MEREASAILYQMWHNENVAERTRETCEKRRVSRQMENRAANVFGGVEEGVDKYE